MTLLELLRLEDSIDERHLKLEEKVAFIVGIAEMGYRFGGNQSGFNFGDFNVIEFLIAVVRPFLLAPTVPSQVAHEFSRSYLMKSEWTCGDVDILNNKVCTMLKPYSELSDRDKDRIKFRRSTILTSLRMLKSIRAEAEEDLLDSMLAMTYAGKVVIH